MRRIGGWLVVLGAGSFLLQKLEREFVLLSWVDNWGEKAGMGIRVGMIVVGALLFMAGGKKAAEG